MTDWFWMLFGMMSRVGQGMGVLGGSGNRLKKGAVFEVKLGHPTVLLHSCTRATRSSQITFGGLVTKNKTNG